MLLKLGSQFKDFSSLVYKSFRQFSKDEEARFRLITGFKLLGVSLLTYILLIIVLYGILAIDLIFFQSQGYSGQALFTETFYDYLLISLLKNFIIVGLSLICIFLIGIYTGHLLLRPFRKIGEYCENYIEKKDASYDPDFFSDLGLLARFSEFFFHLLENFHRNKQIQIIEIPAKYAKIRKPVFEKAFYLHFSLIILGIAIGTTTLLTWIASDLYEGMISLADEVIPKTVEMKYFLTAQADVWASALYLIMFIHFTLYIGLTVHLYSLVSAPAFGIFSTMRGFLKGNYTSRVHLIGYSYLRPHCRMFNKYLDYMVREVVPQKNDDP
jgi:hypothetical protein